VGDKIEGEDAVGEVETHNDQQKKKGRKERERERES
jgi:hypothetical protein